MTRERHIKTGPIDPARGYHYQVRSKQTGDVQFQTDDLAAARGFGFGLNRDFEVEDVWAADMKANYRRNEIQLVVDAGPEWEEDFFRLVVTGAATTKHLNVTPAEVEVIRDLLHAADSLPKGDVRFLFKLVRAAIVGFTADDDTPT